MNNQTTIIEQKTGDLYSKCFRLFDRNQWLAQGALLADQLGLTPDMVYGKLVMDGGCGHGALVYQIAELGAFEVCGVDLQPTPPPVIFYKMKNAKFFQQSLMQLSFKNEVFDLVVSSGVLHHMVNPERGFSEMVRVLKSGGGLVLGVYGKHGLFPWFLWVIRIFTVKLSVIPKSLVVKIVDQLKLDPIWRYQVLDYLYVPILRRYSPEQVKNFFLKYQFEKVKRISNINEEKAKSYIKARTSYSYDHRKFLSKILFGYGFIVISGEKPKF